MTNSVFRCALLACSLQAGSAFFCATALAQNTSEVGIGIGGTTYKGEIAPQYQLSNNRPAFTVFYRRDVSVPITLRGALTAGQLRADDKDVTGVNGGTAPLSEFRQASTKGSVVELSGVVEYNFLDYHDRENKIHFTPYLFLGIAGYYASMSTTSGNALVPDSFRQDGGQLGFAIPAGVGFKYALNQHFNLGLEVGVRKLFTDELDHLSDQSPVLVNSHDQDWYYYNGVSVSYTFYKIRCPRQYKGNKRLLM